MKSRRALRLAVQGAEWQGFNDSTSSRSVKRCPSKNKTPVTTPTNPTNMILHHSTCSMPGRSNTLKDRPPTPHASTAETHQGFQWSPK